MQQGPDLNDGTFYMSEVKTYIFYHGLYFAEITCEPSADLPLHKMSVQSKPEAWYRDLSTGKTLKHTAQVC